MTAEVSVKLDRVRGWLTGSGYGAALFTTQPGVAWGTGGLEDRVVRNGEPRAGLGPGHRDRAPCPWTRTFPGVSRCCRRFTIGGGRR